MKLLKKNHKGFTLAEEVITTLLIAILVVCATGIVMNAIRILSMNIISLNAQARGIAVMDQLTDNLTYAKEIEVVANKNAFPESTESYQMMLYPVEGTDNNSLNSNVRLKYVSGTTWEAPVENKLCQLNSYQAEYTIEKAAGSKFAVIKLSIKRHNKIWYSEYRTIELKNSSLSSEGLSYDSTSGKCLCIGSIE